MIDASEAAMTQAQYIIGIGVPFCVILAAIIVAGVIEVVDAARAWWRGRRRA